MGVSTLGQRVSRGKCHRTCEFKEVTSMRPAGATDLFIKHLIPVETD